jgi:hypothetical protein
MADDLRRELLDLDRCYQKKVTDHFSRSRDHVRDLFCELGDDLGRGLVSLFG